MPTSNRNNKKEKIDNLLLENKAIDIDVVQEEEEKEQILTVLQGNSLSELREQLLTEKQKALIANSKEIDINNAETINNNIEDIVQQISDPSLLAKVIENIKYGKDYNELIRATDGLLNIRNKMQDGIINNYEPNKKGKKIVIRTQLKSADGNTMTTEMGITNE